MPLNEEFLNGVFEGASKEQVEKVLKEFEADTTGLKVNSDRILSESRGYKEKLDKLTADYGAKETGLQKQVEELEAKIKASGTDELKGLYEAEKKKLQEMHTAQFSEAEKKLAALEAEKNTVYADYLNVLMDTEFNKAADKIGNINPATRAVLRDVFFKRNQFDFTELEGKKRFLNKDYKDVNDTLQSFIGTEEGKFFVLSTSTGGGATGSAKTTTSVNNPYKKETWNFTQQVLLEKENPEKANALKSQAGV